MDFLSHLKGPEALFILKELMKEDPDLSKRIHELAYHHLEGVEVEDVAEEVLYDLESLEMDEILDYSIADNGFIEAEDIADEMLAHTVFQHVEEMNRFLNLKMGKEARDYCLGILIGLNQYRKESVSLLKNCATDSAHFYITEILEEWKKREKDPYLLKSFDDRLREEFPDWFTI